MRPEQSRCGMGVLFGGAAVGGPAGVADAEGAVDGMLAQHLFQVAQLARRAAHLKRGAGGAAHGDARRVVAAVFQPPQPFDDDRNYLLGADITDNSAHEVILNDDADAGRKDGRGGPGTGVEQNPASSRDAAVPQSPL